MAKQKKRKRKSRRKKYRIPELNRTDGFHCLFCRQDAPFNERFVPDYYQAAEGHRLYPNVCFSCHVEGADRNGNGQRAGAPKLTPETLEQFFMEDVSDGAYDKAAASFFRVKISEIRAVIGLIKV